MENEQTNTEYLKAFNQGYILNQYQTELAQTLEKALGDSERSQGFKEGAAEWGKNKGDMLKTKDDRAELWQNGKEITEKKGSSYTPKWLQPDRFDTINRQEPDKDLDRERDWDKDLG